jgi:hypothetical protein
MKGKDERESITGQNGIENEKPVAGISGKGWLLKYE